MVSNYEFNKAGSLVSCLNTLLPNVMAFYIKAHAAHWNVEGPDFSQFHEFFEDIYTDVLGSVDPIAENVRKLGGFPFNDITQMAGVQKLKPSGGTRDGLALCADLREANNHILYLIENALDAADEENQQGILNFLAERQDMHQKWDWQLRSHLS